MGGGPAAAGGFNYQAAVTAITLVHAARGAPLGWLDGLVNDVPVKVEAESGGGGDDIRLTFANNEIAEVQVKRGLRLGPKLRKVLADLSSALGANEISYGILVLAPDGASPAIARKLASDLVRMGEGYQGRLGAPASDFSAVLQAQGLDREAVCKRLRIVTVAALESSSGHVAAAQAELGHLCADPTNVRKAWDRLYRDAHSIIEHRGLRSIADIARVLHSAGIALRTDPVASPVTLLEGLCQWTIATNATFTILGVTKPLPIDTAWVPIKAVVRGTGEADPDLGFADLIDNYHALASKKLARDQATFDPWTIGRFHRHAVVVAGPGMGKSTLLTKLARAYALDGIPVLKVSAPAVARRMAATGSAFLEALFALALLDSGVNPDAARTSSLRDWIVLVDDLDRCGPDLRTFLEGLKGFSEGHPGSRVVAVTRPVGYHRGPLAEWRCYDLHSIPEQDVAELLAELLNYVLPDDDSRRQRLRAISEEALETSRAARTAARSPLLLGICAALIAGGGGLGHTRLAFYEAIFTLVERETQPRVGSPPATSAVLGRCLDILGWTIVTSPAVSFAAAIDACGKTLEAELGLPRLKARDLAEQCFRYWERLGLLEQLHRGGDSTLTFVHRTFGEFAAARYFVALEEGTQTRTLRGTADVAAFREPLTFGSALGAAEVVLDELLRCGLVGTDGQARLLHGLEILSEARPGSASGQASSIVGAAVAQASGPHRSQALQVGGPLVVVAARHPALVSMQVRPLLAHEQPWTRLVAWAAGVS